MIGALHLRANEGIDLLVRLHVRARLDFAAAIAIEGRLREDLAGQAHAGAHLGPIIGLAQVIEQDRAACRSGSVEASRTQPRLLERIGPTCAWKPCSCASVDPS